MSQELQERIVAILTQVDELRQREAQLQSEKLCLKERIVQSEEDLQRCHDDIANIKHQELKLKDEMNNIRDELFNRPDSDSDSDRDGDREAEVVEIGAKARAKKWKEMAAEARSQV